MTVDPMTDGMTSGQTNPEDPARPRKTKGQTQPRQPRKPRPDNCGVKADSQQPRPASPANEPRRTGNDPIGVVVTQQTLLLVMTQLLTD